MQRSNLLDVFVTTDMERKILDIFVKRVSDVSPRKRKTAFETAASLLRKTDAPRFQDALAVALTSIEKADQAN